MNSKQRRKLNRQRQSGGHSPPSMPSTASVERNAGNHKSSPLPGQFIRVSDIAEHLGVTSRTIRNWEKSGLIKLSRTGPGSRLVGMLERDFAAWLDRRLGSEEVSV